MLTPAQVFPFFDLQDERYTSHLAMVHSRFSTNTFLLGSGPAEPVHEPQRRNQYAPGQYQLDERPGRVVASDAFGDDISKLFPIVEPDGSDSGAFDNVLEFMLMAGRTLQEAILMMIPEAWQGHPAMPTDKRAMYEYFVPHGALGWPGLHCLYRWPLHRRRARSERASPSRFYITDDDKCIWHRRWARLSSTPLAS